MTDLARLGIEIDSSQTKVAAGDLDKLTAAGQRTERATESLAAAQASAKAVTQTYNTLLKSGTIDQTQYNAAVLRTKQSLGAVEQEYRQAATALRALQQAQNGAASTSGAMRAGMQQAGFQASDFFVQVSAGTSAVRAFSLQAPQMIQAIALMGAESGKTQGRFAAFARFLGGPWGAAITVAVSILGLMATSLLDTGDASEDTSDALDFQRMTTDELTKAIEENLVEQRKSISLSYQAAEAARTLAQENLNAAITKREETKALIDANIAASRLERGGAGGMAGLGSVSAAVAGQQQGDLARQDAALGGLRELARLAEIPIARRDAAAATDAAAAVTLKYEKAEAALTEQYRLGRTSLAEYSSGLTALYSARTRDEEAVRAANRSTRERKAAMTDEQREYERRLSSTNDYISGLEDEIENIGKGAGELRQLEIARRKETAATDQQRLRLEELNAAREEALSTDAREAAVAKDAKATAALDARLRQMDAELTLLGLVGPAREKAALALEEEAFKAQAAEDGILDVESAWQRYLDTRTRGIEGQSALDRDLETARILADEMQRLIGTIGGTGAVGSTIGTLLGLASGNIGSIGGNIGALLQTVTGTQTDSQGRTIARTLGDELREVFKLNGEFGKTMESLLQGAGTGLLAGNALFGNQGAAGQFGSAVGGALGQAAGDALGKGLGGILGSAAGPLGSILGGLLGGALGGLVTGTPRGSATIGAVGGSLGVTGTGGSSNSRIAASSKSAGAVIESLSALADQLGASLDPSKGSVSIGLRDGNFRVDTSGRGITKTKKGAIDFGQDAEAAALFAMQDLIRDGVLVGLRKGTENLLRNAKDLETGVAKALAFEGVFKELAAVKDPIGAALDDLTKEFDRLRTIFAEAGASAEEYAQLEELLAIKRKEAVEEEGRRAVDRLSERNGLEVQLLELLGRKEDALAAARLNELAGLEATLQPLQRMIYELTDARAIMAQFEPLADDLRAFKQELLGGAGGALGFDTLASRFRSTAALAKDGDAEALGSLRTTATEFLDAARANASSALDYQRAVSEVLGAVDSGIFAADTRVEYAQLQIDAINNSANIIAAMKDEIATYQRQIAEQGAFMVRLWQRFDGDGLTVKTSDDTPLQVEVI